MTPTDLQSWRHAAGLTQVELAARLGVSTDRVRGLIEIVQRALPEGGTPEQAMVIAATLVGTMQLARTLGSPTQGKAMLVAARNALLSQYDPT